MNPFDREFWNGVLKASILIEKDLKKLMETGGRDGERGYIHCAAEGEGDKGRDRDAAREVNHYDLEGDRD